MSTLSPLALSFLLLREFRARIRLFFLRPFLRALTQTTKPHARARARAAVCVLVGVYSGASNLFYLTFISFILITFYFGYALIMTAAHAREFRQLQRLPYALLVPQARPLTPGQRFFWVLFEILAPTSAMVTVVFWAVLFSRDAEKVDLRNAQLHIANFVVFLVEVFLSRMIIVPLHWLFVLLFAVAYEGVLLLARFVFDKQPYYVFDWDRGTTKTKKKKKKKKRTTNKSKQTNKQTHKLNEQTNKPNEQTNK